MLLLLFIVFVVLPFFAALSVRFWVWHLPWFRRLKDDAERYDKEMIPAIAATTLRELRRTALAPKIVLTHHLPDAIEEINADFAKGTVFTTVMNVLLLLFALSYLYSKNPATAPNSVSAAFQALATAFPTIYATPASELGLLICVGYGYWTAAAHTRKYRSEV